MRLCTTSTANNNFTWACPMVGAGKGNNTRKITLYLVHPFANDTEGIRAPAGRAQWISSPSP